MSETTSVPVRHKALILAGALASAWPAADPAPDPVKSARRQYKTDKQRQYNAARLAAIKAAGKKPCSGPLCDGAVRPFSEFYPTPSTNLGVTSRCKACLKHLRDQRPANVIADQVDHRRKERLQAIAVYGGQCEGCGDTGGLEFDHVDNNGAEHRMKEEVAAMVHRIASTGTPIADYRLRLLCSPCHRTINPKSGRISRRYIERTLATASDWPVFTL